MFGFLAPKFDTIMNQAINNYFADIFQKVFLNPSDNKQEKKNAF